MKRIHVMYRPKLPLFNYIVDFSLYLIFIGIYCMLYTNEFKNTIPIKSLTLCYIKNYISLNRYQRYTIFICSFCLLFYNYNQLHLSINE